MAAMRRTIELFTQPGMFLDEILRVLEFLSISDISSLLQSSKDLYSTRISNGGSTYSLGTSSSVAGASSSVVADRIMKKIFLSLPHIAMAREVRLPKTFNMHEMSSIRSVLAEHPCCSTLDIIELGVIANVAVTLEKSCQMIERVGELVHEETYDMRYAISAGTDNFLHLQALSICPCCVKLSICGGWCDDCDSYKCMKSHKWCFECKIALDSCLDARVCSVCNLGTCEDCSLLCEVCTEDLCHDCGDRCTLCGELRCHECNDMFQCSNCDQYICDGHDAYMAFCSDCPCTLCESCDETLTAMHFCDICEQFFCEDCREYDVCNYCHNVICSKHNDVISFRVCELCDATSCSTCDALQSCDHCHESICSKHDDEVTFRHCEECCLSFCSTCDALVSCDHCYRSLCAKHDDDVTFSMCELCGLSSCSSCNATDDDCCDKCGGVKVKCPCRRIEKEDNVEKAQGRGGRPCSCDAEEVSTEVPTEVPKGGGVLQCLFQ